MKQQYKDINFRKATRALIAQIDDILEGYIQAGYVITLRSLYYQLVARNIVPNTEQSYKTVGDVVSDGRLAGLLDWDVITDRGRQFIDRPHWDSEEGFLRSVLPQYFTHMWDNQETVVFVVVEKDALAGVIEQTCHKYDVPLLAAKGYPSTSALREFAKERLIPVFDRGQKAALIHMGDHDPSGLDMTNDLEERLKMFIKGEDQYHPDYGDEYGFDFTVDRIALNMDQIKRFRPPPNPAKQTDARFKEYEKRFGSTSWELDSMTPQYLNSHLAEAIESWMDHDAWAKKQAEIAASRKRLMALIKKV